MSARKAWMVIDGLGGLFRILTGSFKPVAASGPTWLPLNGPLVHICSRPCLPTNRDLANVFTILKKLPHLFPT